MSRQISRNFNYIIILLLFLITTGFSQTPKEKLEKAEQYYKSAQFDDAIKILNEISSDNFTDTETKKEALRFLGRSYTAKGLYDEAKESIRKLLELEPPVVEFNPDYEPPVFMKLYYESRKEFSNSYLIEKPDPGMKTMAIIDFKNRSIDKKLQYDPMEQGFADLMINRLNNSTGLKVIERERIQWILDEMNLQDKYDMEGAVRAGKQLGVQTVLLGSFIIVNDQIWLGGRLVKVETSEILLSDEIKGELDDFFDLVDKLSEKISEKINVTLKEDKVSEVSQGPSLDAILAYSIGLNFLEKEDYTSAYAKFQEALKFSPDYEKAKLKAESIEPYL
ncbi:MAG: CsgG/HfaB family protein [Ignavibacteria bacterium]|nr:CsgG/HfaB family protein [Ignavibacteria bacterium]